MHETFAFTSGSARDGRGWLPYFYLFTFFPDVTFHLRVHFDPVRLFFPLLRNSLFSQISTFYFSIIRTQFHPLFNHYLHVSLDLLSINVNAITLFRFIYLFYFTLIFSTNTHASLRRHIHNSFYISSRVQLHPLLLIIQRRLFGAQKHTMDAQ